MIVRYKVIIILISVAILVGINYLLFISKTISKPKESINRFYSINIKDLNEIDKYPEIKEFIIQNGYYKKLQKSIEEMQISDRVYNNKEKLSKEVESKIAKKYNLDKPTQTKLSNYEITLIIKYDENKTISDVQLREGDK